MKVYHLREDSQGVPFDIQVPDTPAEVGFGSGVTLRSTLVTVPLLSDIEMPQDGSLVEWTSTIAPPELLLPNPAKKYSARIDANVEYANAGVTPAGLLFQIQIDVGAGYVMRAESDVPMVAPDHTRNIALVMAPILGAALGMGPTPVFIRMKVFGRSSGAPLGSIMSLASDPPTGTFTLSLSELTP